MPLKITSWNIEHSARLIGDNLSHINENRRDRVRDTVMDMNPDILCVIEGPKGESGILSFAQDVLNGQWEPVLLRANHQVLGDSDPDYDINGTQWIWFLVNPTILNRCRLQQPATWQSFVGHSSWNVHYWGNLKPTRHRHYRHPQVLLIEIGQGHELEIIGQHMKSKINRNPIKRDADGNLIDEYLNEALKARIKLATEARNIRAYIDVRFEQTPMPAILLMGDANDGPGHDYFENRYLFFDLISNLQGNIINADRFFNHALFDYPAALSWTAQYRDEILNIPASQNKLLIDHILMSQALVRGQLPLEIKAGAGFVEHQAYERANAGASASRISSDHRPVSIILSDN
jgi:hypothetical protein